MNNTEELSYIIYMESKGYIFQDEKVPKDTSNSDLLAGEHEEFGFTLVTTDYEYIIGFMAGFKPNDKILNNSLEFLKCVNDLNLYSDVTNFAAIINDKSYVAQLRCRATYWGPYEERTFDKFLNHWHSEKEMPLIHPRYRKFFVQDQAEA